MDPIVSGSVGTGATVRSQEGNNKDVSPTTTKIEEPPGKMKQPVYNQDMKTENDNARVLKGQGPDGKLIEVTKDEERTAPPAVPPTRIGTESTPHTETRGITQSPSTSKGDETNDKPESLAGQVAEPQQDQSQPKTKKDIKTEKKIERERRKKEEQEQKLQREREKKAEKERLAREKKEKKLKGKVKTTSQPGVNTEQKEEVKEAETTGLLSIGTEISPNTETSGKRQAPSTSKGDETNDKPESLAGQVAAAQKEQSQSKTKKDIKSEKIIEKERKKKEEQERKLQREREKKTEKERLAREKKEKNLKGKDKTRPQPGVNTEQKEEVKEADTTGLLSERRQI